jgi:hypothetical protein
MTRVGNLGLRRDEGSMVSMLTRIGDVRGMVVVFAINHEAMHKARPRTPEGHEEQQGQQSSDLIWSPRPVSKGCLALLDRSIHRTIHTSYAVTPAPRVCVGHRYGCYTRLRTLALSGPHLELHRAYARPEMGHWHITCRTTRQRPDVVAGVSAVSNRV